MASSPRQLAAAILLIITFTFVQGRYSSHGCSIKDISVTLTRTGVVFEGNPEFEVVISNKCECPQGNLVVKCPGFSNHPVDPNLYKPLGSNGECLINTGRPVAAGHPVIFKISFPTPFSIVPETSKLLC